MNPMHHPTRSSNRQAKGSPMPCGKILLLGPESTDRDRLLTQLTTLGYRMTVATSTEAATEELTAEIPDVIAVAFHCDLADAMRLVGEVQATNPWVRAVIFGGSPGSADVVEAIRCGASDWISLPDDRGRIPERMQQIMARVQGHRHREARLEELTDTCEQLSAARDEMSDQVDVLCGDLANAYRSMRSQMNDVAMSSEFRAIISQELGVEDMLRTSLEYILKRVGPTNAAVYVRESDSDRYSVGAYVNYQCQPEGMMELLDELGGIICRPMAGERDLIRFDDTREFAEHAGGHLALLADADITAFSCHRDDECLAVFVLFRDETTGFTDEHAATLDVLREIISEQLSQIVHVHKRSACEWPDEPADDGWDLAA